MKLYVTILFCILGASLAYSQECRDTMLLDNSRTVVSCGIDTTGHWWAIREVNPTIVELIVDGKAYGPYNDVSRPIFSNDGTAWTSVYIFNNVNGLVGSRATLPMQANAVVNIVYPFMQNDPWYVLNVSDVLWLTNGERSYQLIASPQQIKFDPSGTFVYYVVQRGNQKVLMKNGSDVKTADDMDLAGVWSDGRPVYGIMSGSTWSVMLGDEELATGLAAAKFLTVNPFGTVCAFLAVAQGGGVATPMMMTDTYIQPWVGAPLQSYQDLVLSPNADLLAVSGTKQNTAHVVYYNSADYPAGITSSRPAFSYGGNQMVYSGTDGQDFVSINGKMFRLKGGGVVKTRPPYITETGSSIAWMSSTTLVTYDFDWERMQMGKMCDTMVEGIYNSRNRTYQALGLYGGRLFLLECKAR